MNVKDGYLFPLVFEDSCDCRYTAYVDDNTFRFVSNQSGEVWSNDSRFSFEQFKIYVKDGSWKILTPQFDHTSELEEAYAHIETLESALEDAVKRLDNWRNGRKESYGLEDEDGEVKLTENELQFKPINEMTLEDWELALKEEWLFEMNNYELPVKVTQVDYGSTKYPVEFNDYLWTTIDGYEWADEKSDTDRDIIKRIK